MTYKRFPKRDSTKKRIESPATRISDGRILKVVRVLWLPSQDPSREFLTICGILALHRISIEGRMSILIENPTRGKVAIHISREHSKKYEE